MDPDNVVSPSDEIMGVFAGLRMVTDITGGVHELQAKQLEYWPTVLFDEIESCEVEVSVGDARQHEQDDGNLMRQNRSVSVTFSLTSKQNMTDARAETLRPSVTMLTHAVQFLFWPDTEVSVLINNYKI